MLKKKIKQLIFGQRVRGEKVAKHIHFKTTLPENKTKDFFEWAKYYNIGILASKEVFY